MATYPASPEPRAPYSIAPEFKTIVNEMGDGTEERIQKWTSSKQRRHLSYITNLTDFNIIRDFFIARAGRAESFSFVCPWDSQTYTMRFDQDIPPVAQKARAGAIANTVMPMYEFSIDLVETNA